MKSIRRIAAASALTAVTAVAAASIGSAAPAFAAPGTQTNSHVSTNDPKTPPDSHGHNGEHDRGESSANGNSTDPMLYQGGWVQESPHLYVVYWGDWSSTNDRYGVQNRLYYFLNAVGGTSWAQTLTGYGYNCTRNSYGCPSGSVMYKNPTGQFRNYWKDSTSYIPPTPTENDMAWEAQRAAAYFGDYSHNAQYVIALPPGHGDAAFVTKGGTTCAWHGRASVSYGDRAVSYTTLPYMPDAGYNRCGNNMVTGNTLDGVTVIESHEYAEAVTDPYPGVGTYAGWYDSTNVKGEIGDK